MTKTEMLMAKSMGAGRSLRRQEKMNDDLISRQAAIDEIRKCRFVVDAIEKIRELPSSQPEIVRCKECKWYELPSHKITENCVRWMKSNGILLPIKPNDYCSYAERRTDG